MEGQSVQFSVERSAAEDTSDGVKLTYFNDIEFTATQLRDILLRMFPYRRLVLSQFTFFNQEGVISASGGRFRRGRRCYVLEDILPAATVLALKERGIPLKSIQGLPALIRPKSREIFLHAEHQVAAKVCGFGTSVSLQLAGDRPGAPELEKLLCENADVKLFWSFNVSSLAGQLMKAARAHLCSEEHPQPELMAAGLA